MNERVTFSSQPHLSAFSLWAWRVIAGLALCFGFVPMIAAECAPGPEQKPTVLTADVEKGKARVLTPKCMRGIQPGAVVRMSFAESGDDPSEIIEVTAVTDTTFTATLSHDHKTGDAIEVLPCYPRDATGEPVGPYRSDQGAVSVGCPKVWRSERIFTVLDGMLRDVDSITLRSLQDLDPNQANLAQILSVVNELQASAQFNQANGINNQFKLQQMKAQRGVDLENFKATQQRNQELLQQRDKRLKELEDLQDQAKSLATTDPGFQPNKDKQTFVIGEIADLNAQIQTQTIADQSLAADQSPALSPPATGTALATLPDSLTKAFQNSLQQPTLPASMQMDNVIELLHQRLAREFTVMYDDLARQSNSYEIYLLQFDIGIVPRHNAKDRDVKVKFRFRDPTVLAYELYPGTSNYNIMRGMDKTNRVGISGAAQTIFGFGLAASFNHERHELRSGLSQSLFVSGFGAGMREFGWLIGPAPYENFVNPGNRIVHALILVPKNRTSRPLDLSVSYCWTTREQRYHWPWTGHPENCSDDREDSKEHRAAETRIAVNLPERPRIEVNKVAYIPSEIKELPDATTPVPAENNYLLLSFQEPIDPNLVITAGNKIINRVRDVRGRAMYGGTPEKLAGNGTEQTAVSASRFGFLEKDSVDPDTWLETSSNSLVMNISRTTAGTDVFPVITLSQPGTKAGEMADFLADNAHIRIGEWKFQGKDGFLNAPPPLFTEPYSSGRITAYVEEVDKDHRPQSIRIKSETPGFGRDRRIWLHQAAQVVVPKKNRPDEGWALACTQDEGTLSCKLPAGEIEADYKGFPDKFKVWVDQPPYFGRPGLWADTDVARTAGMGAQWGEQGYASGDWNHVSEKQSQGSPHADQWQAKIRIRIPQVKPDSADPKCSIEGLEGDDAAQKLRAIVEQFVRMANGLTGLPLKDPPSRGALEQQKARVDKESKSARPIEAKCSARYAELTVTVPFEDLPLVTSGLELKVNELADRIALPELYPRLVPGPVVVSDLKNGAFRLQGERLRAVQQVRLEGNRQASLWPGTTGINTVDFFTKDLKPGTYYVYAVIGTMTVPLQTEDPAKKLQPATITVADPKESQKKDAQPATDEKAKVDVDVKLKVTGDKSAKK